MNPKSDRCIGTMRISSSKSYSFPERPPLPKSNARSSVFKISFHTLCLDMISFHILFEHVQTDTVRSGHCFPPPPYTVLRLITTLTLSHKTSFPCDTTQHTNTTTSPLYSGSSGYGVVVVVLHSFGVWGVFQVYFSPPVILLQTFSLLKHIQFAEFPEWLQQCLFVQPDGQSEGSLQTYLSSNSKCDS